MLQDSEWASMLERDIASDIFKCNILMHNAAPRTPGFEVSIPQIVERAGHRVDSQFIIHCAYVNASDFTRDSHHNRHVFLRQTDHHLAIHQVQPKFRALAAIAMLQEQSCPRFLRLLHSEEHKIRDSPEVRNDRHNVLQSGTKRRRGDEPEK